MYEAGFAAALLIRSLPTARVSRKRGLVLERRSLLIEGRKAYDDDTLLLVSRASVKMEMGYSSLKTFL